MGNEGKSLHYRLLALTHTRTRPPHQRSMSSAAPQGLRKWKATLTLPPSPISSQSLHLPGGSDGKASAYDAGRPGFNPWVRKTPWRRKWHPTPVFLPGKPYGQRSLAGYSPWGRKESDWVTSLSFFHCILLFFHKRMAYLYFPFHSTHQPQT